MYTYETAVTKSIATFQDWKNIPAPARGELVRVFGDILRVSKETIAQAITSSMYKTIRESRGEVQEAIDMCDFAVGLSRQLYGVTMPSERPEHRLQELWLPLGPVGVITAFNFPCAVWAWNFCLAAVCGNTVLWKPSEKSPNVAHLMHQAWQEACVIKNMEQFIDVSIVLSDEVASGKLLASDSRIPLISATGSVKMGMQVASIVGARLGKCLLELGGNNVVIVSDKADLDLAVKGCVFGVVGTTGQRCTSTRRIIAHESIIDQLIDKMHAAFKTVIMGDPMDEDVLVGPVIDQDVSYAYGDAIFAAMQAGAEVIYGDQEFHFENDDRTYLLPTIVRTDKHLAVMDEETFAPIVYVMPYKTLDEALELANCVKQGLSSSIFTDSVLESEYFLKNSYTGIVNINTGTSGAEIGGAFGGEKDTGGGRESGSDSWKAYMRRVTSTVNFSGKLPLAQGIKFE